MASVLGEVLLVVGPELLVVGRTWLKLTGKYILAKTDLKLKTKSTAADKSVRPTPA
jgi:hypothetical protein